MKIFKEFFKMKSFSKPSSTFAVMINKEVQDYVRSWKFIVLLAIILLTCCASAYSSISKILENSNVPLKDETLLFLKIFTLSDGALPSFYIFISFLGPLLGIVLGFDTINSEYSNRTIGRVLAQPVYRDVLINSKVIAAMLVIGVLFAFLTTTILGIAILATGQAPSFIEVFRILSFLLVVWFYVAFWLNLSVFFSIRFSQTATSALMSVSVWLFFLVFYPMIISVVAQVLSPSVYAGEREVLSYQHFILGIMRLAPSQLFMDAATALLNPQVRSLGPLTMEQVHGTLPGNLPFWESVKIVWAQITGLVASSMLCFVCSYYFFMRKEVRA